ncbi:aryl-sulfate sulfotransferase [Campylobacter jejuni]|nr:aryl-sulfate sulfotransferase [Campylobacter jejuni]ELS2485398.1 aryl-sulfate sulfotransferase [Campylobacter jejuni]
MNWGNIYNRGIMISFRQNKDGALTWGFGQRYVKYDVWEEKFSIANYLLWTICKKWALFLQQILCVQDSKHVRTVCDTIIEVDEDGNVVDDWRLYEILDPYRSTIIKTLDQSAVCLNIDASKVGKTLSDEELAKMDESDKFGDIAGIGRNWAHIKGGIKNFKNIYCNL